MVPARRWPASGAASRTAAATSPLQPSLLDRMTQNHGLDFSPAFQAFDLLARVFSPYQFNPMNFNPLRHILEQSVDFERLRESSAIKLFLNATNVRTGKVRLFRNAEITTDAVMASACLPLMFQAVEIDGEAYWDGGYMGNPAIFPLIYECASADVVVVHINPIARPRCRRTAAEILNRIDEISFNSSLMREMRAVAFVTRLIDEGNVKDGSMKRMLIHSIAAEDFMQQLGVNSKMNADWEFLTHLRDAGRAKASRMVGGQLPAPGQAVEHGLRAVSLSQGCASVPADGIRPDRRHAPKAEGLWLSRCPLADGLSRPHLACGFDDKAALGVLAAVGQGLPETTTAASAIRLLIPSRTMCRFQHSSPDFLRWRSLRYDAKMADSLTIAPRALSRGLPCQNF